ncbi:ComEC family competence protein [Rhizobium sp. P32RR-XVIII]|uniref:ComEC/Rec2 family competence protein n=1 Tax=Rhizobium sp. P32RR-XVIII TaxID=2726738 RepID=UPI0014570F82|nr:ComEC family competence protein [Rhizobium sp. P32RR-XVIII]
MPELRTSETHIGSSVDVADKLPRGPLPAPADAARWHLQRTQNNRPLLAAVPRMRAQLQASVLRMAGEETAHGARLLFAPVFLGLGAAIWFVAGGGVSMRSSGPCLFFMLAALAVTNRNREVLRAVLTALVLIVCGILAAQFETRRAATLMLDSAVTTTLTGRVERREGDGRGGWRYVLSVRATEQPLLKRPPARVTVVARGRKAEFETGTWLKGRARLTPPAGPALPGLNDFAVKTYFDGVGANGFFYGAPVSVPSGQEDARNFGENWLEWLYHLRSGIGDRIRSILPGDTGAFAAALVTDERRAISSETTEALRQSGLAHIIAISGLNMALSAGIFFVGFRSILSLFPGVAQAYPTKKIAAAGALAAVTAYFLISGFAVSAERAFIMMAIMLVAVFFDRPSISLHNVALSALLIIAVSPSEIMGPSFQMSFAATLALVAGYALWKERPVRESPFSKMRSLRLLVSVSGFFGGILLTSVIGGLSTALFSIEHFHRLTAYGLPANLAAMPIISFVIMPAGLLAMLLMPFGLDVLPWKVVGFGLDLVIAVAKTVSSWGGDIGVGRLPGWYFPAAVAGFLLLTLLRTRLRHMGAAIIAGSTLAVALMPGRAAPDVVIAEDGSLVAIVRQSALASNRERPPDFIFDQWKRALVIDDHRPPKLLDTASAPPSAKDGERLRLSPAQQEEARDAMRNAASAGHFTCVKKAWCTAELENGSILAVIENAAYFGPACDTADIVVTPVRLRSGTCRSGAMLFTGETLRKTGAVELRFGDGTADITTAFENLDRPWSRHRAYDWRSGTFAGDALPVSDSGE